MTPPKNFDERVREEGVKYHYHRLGEVRYDCEKCARFKAGAKWARSQTIREAADIADDVASEAGSRLNLGASVGAALVADKIRHLDPHQEEK